MPFLDWVNKNQAKQVTGEVPYRLLDFQTQHGDAGAGDNLLIQGDNARSVEGADALLRRAREVHFY